MVSSDKDLHNYHKVTYRSMSYLVVPLRIFRLLMKGKFDAYLLSHFGDKLNLAIVA